MKIASTEQQLAFNEIKNGKGNVALQASAGTGKTFVLLESLKLIPRLKKSVFLSFSNAIVNEIKERIPSYVKASTLHSLGCRMIKAKYPSANITENKYFNLALQKFPKTERNKETYRNCYAIQDLCNYARLTLTPFKERALQQLCETYCLDAHDKCVSIAESILKSNVKANVIQMDFADMVTLPAMFPEFINETFDYIFLDESQDCNAAQTKFIQNILNPKGGRLISVGDHFQSIYGFQGSSIDSFKKIQEQFKATVLPLTVTYRCAKKIVELAQTVYPDVIQPHPDAIEGDVRQGSLMEAEAGDMVLCRNTKPLIASFFTLIANDKKAYIVGKDYEKGLIDLAETVSASDVEIVISNMERKLDNLLADLKFNGTFNPKVSPKYIALLEKCDIIELILNKIEKPSLLVSTIRDIFHEDKKAIRLISIHRAKGLESKRVFYIETFEGEKLIPSKYAKMEWELTQEENLRFVAYTRAKEQFITINI